MDSLAESNPPQTYVSLHNHSYYSLLDGMDAPQKLAETAKKHGMTAVALTDHGSCAGLWQLQKACKEIGIKPILGMEGYYVPNVEIRDKSEKRLHLTIWAKNKVGCRNLFTLSSLGFLKGHYGRPRIDIRMLREHHEGLMIGSACAMGIICGPAMDENFDLSTANAQMFQEIFGEDFYIEIMSHQYFEDKKVFSDGVKKAMKFAYELSVKLGIKAIYTCDSHYCLPQEAEAQDVALSIQQRNTTKNPDRFSFKSNDFYMKSPKEVYDLCGEGFKHIVTNTLEVANKVEEDLIEPGTDLLPKFELPSGITSDEKYLQELLQMGMQRRGLIDKTEYRERIKQEYAVIVKTGYTKYFLILWDMVRFAREKGIRIGPGRGSGVSSLALYCLGVTVLDPIKYKLLFSRFLNSERISPPDVDMDFQDNRRDEVFQYLRTKYGEANFSRISTYGEMHAKEAIKSTAKVLDIGGDWEAGGSKPTNKWNSGRMTLDLCERMSKAIPEGPDVTIDMALTDSAELRWYQSRFPKVFDLAKQIEGRPKNISVHAAGALICINPVINHIPLRLGKDKRGIEYVCSQFTMSEVEQLGLLKFDILAIKDLTAIEKCLQMVRKRGLNPPEPNDLDPIDPNVFKILNEGKTDGIFQFESEGMTRLLGEIKVNSFEDMIVANALYRPPILRAGIHGLYCDYKHGRKEVTYLHPMLKEVLRDTYGMMIYQEDVIRTAQVLGGYSESKADLLRKAIGKKDQAIMNSEKGPFIESCTKTGVLKSISEQVFSLIEKFAGYGFNRSHAAAYAHLAYQTAWLKYYFPHEFYCALLSSEGDSDKRNDYERYADAFRNPHAPNGVKILSVDINRSGVDYAIQKEGILRPLDSLDGIGGRATEDIVAHQPYTNLMDFVTRTESRAITSKVFGSLVQAGCLSMWGKREDLLREYENLRERVKKKAKRNKTYGETEGGLWD